jgi:periplasmic protein TonB
MSYALATPTPIRRGSLFAIVVGLHAGILLAIVAARTVLPEIPEMPMVVEMFDPEPEVQKEEPPQAKPLPVAKPQPLLRQAPAPQPLAPPLETTASPEPAPAAAVAAPPENKPVTPGPPATPATEASTPARFDANYLRNPAPPYPTLSRRMGEEGRVILRVAVNPQGIADSVEVKTSSGSSRLDESALRTVRTWKFIPAKRGDTAVQSVVLVPIIFKLEQ